MKNPQTYALGAIVVTICLAFFAIVLGTIFEKPVDDATRLAVFGAFFGLVGTATAWLGVTQVAKEQEKTLAANLKAENAQTQLQESLRYSPTVRTPLTHQAFTPPPPPTITGNLSNPHNESHS